MVERIETWPGYSISRVIKGGWQLSGDHGQFNRDEAVADMAKFLDAGITTFDCAGIYTGVEVMIGDFLEMLRNDRGSEAVAAVQVQTKLVPDFDKLEVFSASDLEALVDRSLKRLRIDTLPLLQFYWWDLERGNPFGVMGTLADLQKKGKIQKLGTTNFDEDTQAQFVEHGLELKTAQVQYSLLDTRPDGTFSKWCADTGVQIHCYGVLAGGFLTDEWLGVADPGYQFENRSLIKYRLIIDEFGGWDLFQELMAALRAIADKHGVTLSAVASRAMLDRSDVGAIILGAKTARTLDQTLGIFSFALDEADNTAIAGILARSPGPTGKVYGLERDKTGTHGRIMKYNLNTGRS